MDIELAERGRRLAAAYVEGWDKAREGRTPIVLNLSDDDRVMLREGHDDAIQWMRLWRKREAAGEMML